MKNLLIASLVCTVCAASALAQQEPDTDAFDGKWNVSVQTAGGSRLDARVSLHQFAGTWQDVGIGSLMQAKACRGKRYPITVQVSVEALLEFTVWGSAVSPACPDINVTVKPSTAKTLEGKTTGGEAIKMSRR